MPSYLRLKIDNPQRYPHPIGGPFGPCAIEPPSTPDPDSPPPHTCLNCDDIIDSEWILDPHPEYPCMYRGVLSWRCVPKIPGEGICPHGPEPVYLPEVYILATLSRPFGSPGEAVKDLLLYVTITPSADETILTRYVGDNVALTPRGPTPETPDGSCLGWVAKETRFLNFLSGTAMCIYASFDVTLEPIP